MTEMNAFTSTEYLGIVRLRSPAPPLDGLRRDLLDRHDPAPVHRGVDQSAQDEIEIEGGERMSDSSPSRQAWAPNHRRYVLDLRTGAWRGTDTAPQ